MSPDYLQPKKLPEVLAELKRTWAVLNRHHGGLQATKDHRRMHAEADFIKTQLSTMDRLLDDLKRQLPKAE